MHMAANPKTISSSFFMSVDLHRTAYMSSNCAMFNIHEVLHKYMLDISTDILNKFQNFVGNYTFR
jgi:hypothetical protein